jgi:hypothetical protein
MQVDQYKPVVEIQVVRRFEKFLKGLKETVLGGDPFPSASLVPAVDSLIYSSRCDGSASSWICPL